MSGSKQPQSLWGPSERGRPSPPTAPQLNCMSPFTSRPITPGYLYTSRTRQSLDPEGIEEFFIRTLNLDHRAAEMMEGIPADDQALIERLKSKYMGGASTSDAVEGVSGGRAEALTRCCH